MSLNLKNFFPALYWSLGRIISLGKFKKLLFVFILVSPISFSLEAREQFEFDIGDKVNILSDKGYRRIRENIFEAVGNVVITHKAKTLYGEKASIDMNTGQTNLIGNVRYVGPEMTIYGSEINYNFLLGSIDIKNARVISENYVVLGKTLSKLSDNTIIGTDAEYTTCRDCPESWSLFGKNVEITLGEYVRIKHAYLKVKGVVIMYIPYVIFPIKKQRETGLLFPSFGLNLSDGLRFQLPWFWAIDNHKDMTITPSIWGNRGNGGELQYRQVLGQKKWFEFNSLHSMDRIYTEFKQGSDLNNSRVYRHFFEYEHNFFISEKFNTYLYLNDVNDLDVVRDYDQFIGEKIEGATLGAETFIDSRFDFFNLSVDAFFKKHQLVNSSKKFDHSFVQVLPNISLTLNPVKILESDLIFLKDISFGLNSDFTYFKQNHLIENNFIRNALRLNSRPFLYWNLGRIGPVEVSNLTTFDYQYYHFPYETDEDWFSKSGAVFESEVSLEFEKFYGAAYREVVPADQVEVIAEKNENENKANILIGKLPVFELDVSKDTYQIVNDSFRHSQQFKFKHYYISNQKTDGSNKFYNQIINTNGSPNINGLFDQVDTIRGRENELNYLESRTTLPTSNTLELQWNNSLTRKSPRVFDIFKDEQFIRNNFTYSRIAYINFSQGIDFNSASDEFIDKLTRLAINTGLNLYKTNLSLSEYFYHRSGEHITKLNLSRTFDLGSFGTSLVYDSFTEPINKFLGVNFSLRPIDIIALSGLYEYDLNQNLNSRSLYNISYRPINNCWMLNFSYETTLYQKRYSFNFMINFNENNFTSLNGMGQ